MFNAMFFIIYCFFRLNHKNYEEIKNNDDFLFEDGFFDFSILSHEKFFSFVALL